MPGLIDTTTGLAEGTTGLIWLSSGLGGDGLGVVTAWTPIQLPSLFAWYEANVGVYSDAGTTLATNGQTVQQWNDQSGAGKHLSQATSAKRPTFNTGVQNNLSGISFVSGNGQFLATATIALGGTTASVFAVIKGSTPPADNRGVSFIGGADANDFSTTTSSIIFYYPTTTSVLALSNGVNLSTGAVTNGAFTQIGSIFDGTNHTMYIGGTAQTAVGDTNTFGATGKFGVGGQPNGNSPLDGTILELIITSNAVSAANRANIKSYFTTKWAV